MAAFPVEVDIGDRQPADRWPADRGQPCKAPEAVDWRAAGIDLLVECSGATVGVTKLQRFH
jgi:hypothetical protein